MKLGDRVAGRFALVRTAGHGGMGTVFLARDELTGDHAAVKVLRQANRELIARFDRETDALSRLIHPGIVRYRMHGLHEGAPFLAMDWLEGEDLASRLIRGPLSPDDAVSMARRAAHALGFAHAAGIVHRDCKPSNLFLLGGDPRNVVLLDFGIARIGTLSRETGTGVAIGTPGYMAPEQAAGERAIEPSADVFSLGCVLFEALSGSPAFAGGQLMAILAKILIAEVDLGRLPSGLPSALVNLIAAMLHKEADARPADGLAVAAVLDGIGPLAHLPSASITRPVLTHQEQRLVSVVALRSTDDTTMVSDAVAPGGLTDAVSPFGARLVGLADGTTLAVIGAAGSAADLAVAAARCALALQAALPDAPIAVSTGRGQLGGMGAAGEAIDRVAGLFRERVHGQIRVDSVTARLLEARFDTIPLGDEVFALGEERSTGIVARALLGKAVPCVGRERDLGLLTALLDECIAEPRARAALVLGPPGIGKSRLRAELVGRARQQGATVWLATHDAMRSGAPLGGISALAPDLPFDADVAPDQVATTIRLAWLDLVAETTAAGPLVLVLEDLHWGDAPSIALIDAALARCADAPLFVVAFARPEVRERFAGLFAAHDPQTLELAGISARSAERLVKLVLGDRGAAVTARLVETAHGNPFYLEELIRAEAERRPDAPFEAPAPLLATVQSRLEGLPTDLRRVVRAAAVFGESFWTGGVSALVGGSLAGDAFAELVQREVFARSAHSRFADEPEYRFRHGLVREAAYGMLLDDDRTLGHRLAAGWLETREPEALVLAEHFERGGLRRESATWWVRAAEEAVTRNDAHGASERANKAIAAADDDPEPVLGRALAVMADAAILSLGAAECIAASERAIAALPQGSEAWCRALGTMLVMAGSLGDSARVLSATDRLLAVTAGSSARSEALCVASNSLRLIGQRDAADRALAAVGEPGADAVSTTASVAHARACQAYFDGDIGRACAEFERALGIYEQIGAFHRVLPLLNDHACALATVGDFEGAERGLVRYLELADRLGLKLPKGDVLANLAMVHVGRGDGRAAADTADRAAAILEPAGRTRFLCFAWLQGARGRALCGDPDAIPMARRAVALDVEPFVRAHAQAALAEILVLRGHHAEALTVSESALTAIPDGADLEDGLGNALRLAHAEALQGLGRSEGPGALGSAAARLRAQAAVIGDERLRGCFERIPWHARLLQA